VDLGDFMSRSLKGNTDDAAVENSFLFLLILSRVEVFLLLLIITNISKSMRYLY
jgi:hypothetical protein